MIEAKILPVPPADFLRRLYEYDRNLQLNFDPTHGVWAIWCKDPISGRLDHVMSVVEPNGSFRPLDERVFLQLRANRYYQQNPDELKKVLIDDLLTKRENDQKFVHDEMKHVAKDKSLKKRFEKVRDLAGSVPWDEWKKPFVLHDKAGNVLHNAKGNAIMYKPDKSFFENGGKKPTTLEEIK